LLFCFALTLMAADNKPIDLKMHDLSGKKVELRSYRSKPVVLNFWATWCGPCREEMPMLVEAQKRWTDKGVTFIGVSLDDKKTIDQVPEFTQRFHVPFDIWTGASADDLDRLRLGQGVPDTVFLDDQGRVVARVLGEIRRNELDERLEWLTGDRKGPAPAALVNHM
jgi:thiol-disulfide isomerase/thioredoxin